MSLCDCKRSAVTSDHKPDLCCTRRCSGCGRSWRQRATQSVPLEFCAKTPSGVYPGALASSGGAAAAGGGWRQSATPYDILNVIEIPRNDHAGVLASGGGAAAAGGAGGGAREQLYITELCIDMCRKFNSSSELYRRRCSGCGWSWRRSVGPVVSGRRCTHSCCRCASARSCPRPARPPPSDDGGNEGWCSLRRRKRQKEVSACDDMEDPFSMIHPAVCVGEAAVASAAVPLAQLPLCASEPRVVLPSVLACV